MSLKSKVFSLLSSYKSFCEKNSKWENSDNAVSNEIKDSMKYRFALFPSAARRFEYAVEQQTKELKDEIRELKEILKKMKEKAE